MSWLFSRALVEEYSEAIFSGGEPSAQLNVMPTAQPFWRNDKPMDCSRFSRFGLTSRLLTDTDGEAVLTSFLVDFPARTSALPEKVKALTEPEAGSGFKWPGSFAKYSPTGCTWKTRQCSLLGGLDEFSETWPRWGSMRNGECSARQTSALHIFEKESGLLPTPTAKDSEQAGGLGSIKRGTRGLSLHQAAKVFPTPTSRDWRSEKRRPGKREKRMEDRRGTSLPFQVNGSLNPTWVEWLMGFPLGWTALEPLETAKYLEWQQQHGESFAYGNREPG